MELQTIVSAVLIMQFLAFGWRVNREMTVSDPSSRRYVPAPDVFNLVSMLAVVGFCVLVPMKSGTIGSIGRWVLGVALVLIALHPLNVAAHYGLFSSNRRDAQDARYMTTQEIFSMVYTIVIAALVGYWLS
jgi:hypothetical protein